MNKEDGFRLVEGSPLSGGREAFRRHLEGKKQGPVQAIKAKCFTCMGGWADGRTDCGMEQCPLYPWQPYRRKG